MTIDTWRWLGFTPSFWLYLIVSAMFAANVAIRAVAWWYTRMDDRLKYAKRTAMQGLVLYAFCTFTSALAALSVSPWLNRDFALWAVRVGWLCIAIVATAITDQWIAELNGHSSGIYHIWHWSQALPKRKLAMVGLLLAVLWMATACAPLPTAAPLPRGLERNLFVSGAQYGCSGMVLSMAQTLQLTITPEIRGGVMMLCLTYAEEISRVVTAGEMLDPGAPAPHLWAPKDPM